MDVLSLVGASGPPPSETCSRRSAWCGAGAKLCHSMRCAVRTRVSVRCPFAHDFPGAASLIRHPRATSFLSVFSIFHKGSGCCHLGSLVKRERVCCVLVLNSVTYTPQLIRQPEYWNEERGGGLGRLLCGGSCLGVNDGVGILLAQHCAFVVLNEAGVCLDKVLAAAGWTLEIWLLLLRARRRGHRSCGFDADGVRRFCRRAVIGGGTEK